LQAATLLCLITDRRALGPAPVAYDRLVLLAGDAARAGIDIVQLREPDLPACDLVALARRMREAMRGSAARLVVNDRLDVAIAARADGVHLATHSLRARDVRACAGAGLLVGASTHSAAEAAEAEAGGVDYAVCGPVYDTPSKRGMGTPLGPDLVGAIALAARVPVLALGGISRQTATETRAAGAAGIAAIRLFQEAWLEGRLPALVAELRRPI
jgi:thiamine-phosphate pyrophosphorylase